VWWVAVGLEDDVPVVPDPLVLADRAVGLDGLVSADPLVAESQAPQVYQAVLVEIRQIMGGPDVPTVEGLPLWVRLEGLD
jgi:hypothetical protein